LTGMQPQTAALREPLPPARLLAAALACFLLTAVCAFVPGRDHAGIIAASALRGPAPPSAA